MQGCVEGIEFRCYRLPCSVFCVGWMSIHQRLKGHGMFHGAFPSKASQTELVSYVQLCFNCLLYTSDAADD